MEYCGQTVCNQPVNSGPAVNRALTAAAALHSSVNIGDTAGVQFSSPPADVAEESLILQRLVTGDGREYSTAIDLKYCH